MGKGYIDFSFFGPGFCSSSPLSVNNTSINYLVKTFLQAKWVLIREPFIHFVLTEPKISKFIFRSAHIKKDIKIKKNLILILLYIKTMF